MFVVLASIHAVLECLKFIGVIVILMDWLGDPDDELVQQINSFVYPVIHPFVRLAQAISIPPQFAISLFLFTVIMLDSFIKIAMKF